METWNGVNAILYNNAKAEFDKLVASMPKPILPKPKVVKKK